MQQLSQIGNLVSILAIVLMSVLAVASYLGGSNKISNKVFVFFNTSAIIWVATNLMANLSISTPALDYLFWTKTTLIGPIFMVFLLIIFADAFPDEKIKLSKGLIVILSIVSFVLLLLTPTDLYIKSVSIINSERMISSYQPGILMTLFTIYFIVYTIFAIVIFIRKLFLVNKKEKKQISIVLAGIVLSLIGGVIMSVILPLTGYNNLINISPIASTFFIIFTAYAILKHQFLNVRVIATETLVIFIVIVLLIEALLSKSTSELITRSAFLLLVIYFGYLLIKSVISEIERRKEVERLAEQLKITNSDLLTLQHINNKMVSTLDVKKVSQEIVESLSTELSWKGGFLALINEKKERIYIEAITQTINKKIRPLLKKPLYKYTLPVRGSSSVIQQSIHRLEIEFTSSLDDLIFGICRAEILRKIQFKLKIETFAAAPIVYRGKVIGVLVAGFSKKTTTITSGEKKMISSIADQAAIAIENAKLYEQIERANLKLKDLDKLKNEFLSIASHQVRTPLSIIKGYISLLRAKKAGELSEQQDHFMKNIQEANDQLINIINDFLNLSRIEQKRMKLEISETDVVRMINEVVERLNHEAELKDVKLKFENKAEELPKINIDEPKIIEVITNLVDNAIKYSPNGGEVEVKASKKRHFLIISVKDSGIGIPKSFRDKLFQKFSRAHNAIQVQPNGNGIGLFLVKKIIDAHQGKISVWSKQHQGTKFTIKLDYESGLSAGEEIDVNRLEKEGIIRYNGKQDENSNNQTPMTK